MTQQLYTSSRLKVLRECLRKHFYQYVLFIRTAETDAMRFGTVTHKALEAYFRAWQRGEMDARLPAAIQAINDSELHAYDKARVRVLVIAYHTRWGSEPWEIIAVEQEFRYELGEYVIGGKIDALIKDLRDGRVYVLEHKTTKSDASPGSAYWEKLVLDSQISIYTDGATILGHEIAGCIYDVIKRPLHEPKLATPQDARKYTVGKGCKECGGSAKPGAVEKGRGYKVVTFVTTEHVKCDDCDGTGWKKDKDGKPEAPRLHSNQRESDEALDEFEDRVLDDVAERPDEFLIRNVVVRLDDDLPRMRQALLDTIKLERATHLLFGDSPPVNPDACARYGSICPFFGACSGRSDISDEQRFPRGTAHPELAHAA